MSILKKSKEEWKNPDELSAADICPSPYSDFRSGASWRIFRIMAEFIEGFQFLADLKKEVTFFGSARVGPSHYYYKEARKLAVLLGRAGFSIITGGGPGIMEAANRGAVESGAPSVGLNIELPREQRINRYVRKARSFHYFFTRKVMLAASAQAYIFFPGGYGTVDEFLEIITLIQTKKMCAIPVVLVGKKYWNGFFTWAREAMLEDKYIAPEDLKLFTIVDSADEAFSIVKETAERKYF